MFNFVSESRRLRKRKAELEKRLEVAASTVYDEDYEIDRSIYAQETELDQNELDYMAQCNLFSQARERGLSIPADKIVDYANQRMSPLLTADGEEWVRRELHKLWRSDVEFWAKVVLPVLSLVLSIIALCLKTK